MDVCICIDSCLPSECNGVTDARSTRLSVKYRTNIFGEPDLLLKGKRQKGNNISRRNRLNQGTRRSLR